METPKGKWQITCDSPNFLSVVRLEPEISLIYEYSLNGEGFDNDFNKRYVSEVLKKCNHAISIEVLHKLEIPSFLKNGETIIINVSDSGKYYIDDNT